MTKEKSPAGQGEGKDPKPTYQGKNQIVTMMTDTAAARQSQGPRAPRPRYVQCARGAELQATREAAGMTHEQAARRIPTVWNLQNPHRNHGRAADDLGTYDLTKTVPKGARELARLERTSQDAYDRAVAESDRRKKDMDYCKTIRETTWRPWARKFDEALDAITLGPVDATLDELRHALGIVTAATAEAKRAAKLDELRERGASIARLVWNNAGEQEFLDQALFHELRGPASYRDGRIDGASGYLVRAVLGELAHELRVTFPQRPAMEAAA